MSGSRSEHGRKPRHSQWVLVRSSTACTTKERATATLAAASERLAAPTTRFDPRRRLWWVSSAASCPGRMAGAGSGVYRPTRDDTRRCSTAPAAGLLDPATRISSQTTWLPAPHLASFSHALPWSHASRAGTPEECCEMSWREESGSRGSTGPNGAGACNVPSLRGPAPPESQAP